MATPTVDTFEHDIADEIRHKEASISDIATAVGDIGNREDDGPKKQVALLSVVTILVLCGLVGALYLGYMYYNGGSPTSTPIEKTTPLVQQQNRGLSLSTVSKTLDQALGNYLTNVEKTNNGYKITITSYSPVFAYMIKHESEFGDEIALAVGNTHTIKERVQKITPNKILATSTLLIGTSTQATGTSTASTSVVENIPSTEYIFSDITMSNQNMRVGTSVYGTVVYAFIGINTLVISSSPEGILSLRSSILHK